MMKTDRTVCRECLNHIRAISWQRRKAMEKAGPNALCTDCGQRAEYIVGVFENGTWIPEQW